MINFNYHAPTQVVFGKGSEEQTGALIKAGNWNKVLIHYGGKSAIDSGLLSRVRASLEMFQIPYTCLGGVVPNPRLSKVYEGIALGKKEKVDFILAVGGGSVIDSAKAIGYGLFNEGDVWDFYVGKRAARGCVPIGAVLTLAAAGSEMSNSSVITNEEGWQKRGYKSEYCRCRFAVMNPEVTSTMPAYQTGCGCTDILMHTMERYFAPEESMELTDSISEALMRTVMHNAGILMKDPQNYEARAEIMWAGSLSHNGLTGCGATGDWACHQLEHELGGMFDVAHGAGLAAIWGSWARYVYRKSPKRFARFAVRVLQLEEKSSDNEKMALLAIERMEYFFREIGMPVNLRELGIQVNETHIQELAYNCSFQNTRKIGGFQKLDMEDMKNIYTMAQSNTPQ